MVDKTTELAVVYYQGLRPDGQSIETKKPNRAAELLVLGWPQPCGCGVRLLPSGIVRCPQEENQDHCTKPLVIRKREL